MKYRDILGFPKTKKKIVKEQLKPINNSVLDNIKQELNEWDGTLTESKETIFDVAQRVLDNHQNEKWKGVRIDVQTANLIKTVHGKINPKTEKILIDLANKKPKQILALLWGLVK